MPYPCISLAVIASFPGAVLFFILLMVPDTAAIAGNTFTQHGQNGETFNNAEYAYTFVFAKVRLVIR
jgi:hypothetical protein